MDFSRWLTAWLRRHPLKAPSDMGPAYTREVISKLGRETQRTASPVRWWSIFSSPAYAMVSLAAIALIVTALIQRPSAQTARQATRQTAVLAESTESGDAWIQQTMQLLDQLEQDSASNDAATTQSDEEWLNELETLDEADLNSSS